MDSEQITVNSSDREYRKKRVEELGSTLAQIRARVKANRGSGPKKDEEVQQSGGSNPAEDTERTAKTKKILEEDRARFTKLQQNRVKMKEAMDQMLIEREEQKKVEKQLQEAIAKVTAPTPELPPLIKQRIMDLETTVDNLKERLSEKDKVLSSKTQALTVLHNQLMQRSQEQVEKAMAFTQEISTIKEDFGKREELLKKEISRLKEREEELECRLSDKEMHMNEVESLQSELTEVKKDLNDSLSRNEESSKQLESINKINLKLKAQLKALKIERDKLKQAQESVEDLEALKNRIALLEEEKGNLQLQLVDFDDVKESFEESKNKIKFLQDDLGRFQEDLKHLTEEKVSLQGSLNEANKKIEEQENVIQSLRISLKELEEQKISAEMRSIEIEEKMEGLQSSSSVRIGELMSEILELKNVLGERNSSIHSLNQQLSLKDQEISDIKGNNFPAEVESDARLKEIEMYNSELMEKVRELQLKAENHEQTAIQLSESLSERNETINSLKMKYDELKMTVTDLNNNKTLLENEIQRLKANEVPKRENEGPSNTESKEDPNLTQKFKKLAANYKIKVKLCQELEEKLKKVEGELNEKNKLIISLQATKDELQLQVDGFNEKEESLRSELDAVKIKNGELLRLVEELTPRLEAMEVERSSALIKADRMNRAFEELKEWKEGDSKLLKEHVSSVNSMASNVSLLEQELGKLQTIVSEKNSVIGELETERKKLVEDMRNSEYELERLRGLYQQESVKNQNVLTNLQGLESEMLVSREEMNQIAEQLNTVTKNYNMCLSNLQERENYIEALEQDIVGMKTKMYNLEAGIGDRHRILEERGNQLSARLEEAEILTQTFDKYQAEMDNKFKIMEENEKSMKFNLSQLQNEIESLSCLNKELKLKNEAYEKKVSEMTNEISSLNDVKNSYNSTLDRIEVLNEELKQVMCDFEAKNQEILRLGEERADIFNKLTDLEDAYSDLRGQLEEAEENSAKLQLELDGKTSELVCAVQEIKSLKKKICELQELPKEELKYPTNQNFESASKEAIQVFSWDEHSQIEKPFLGFKGEGDTVVELENKTKMLDDARKEIERLNFQLAMLTSQKDAEILALKEEIMQIKQNELQRVSESERIVSTSENMSVFSWDHHNQPSKLLDDRSHLEEELKESQNSLKLAKLENEQLRASMESTVFQNEKIIGELREELQKLLNEKSELEKSLSGGNQNSAISAEDVKLFSWGHQDQAKDEELLKLELKEKTKSLENANLEIANLQSALNSILSEKESEISAMKQEITRLLNQNEELEKMSQLKKDEVSETKQEDMRMFSWGQGSAEEGKEEEDGWGWIGAEAHLDHKHSEALQIQTLTQRVRELEQEQISLNEKLNASKIKCIKLLKKLKEMEAVQEQSRNERNVGFSDLDFALQEEMRSQLDQAETKNKELATELNNLKLERDNLNKKVDVLISANEQLIEMKERQDIEVQMWQKRSVELKNEVQGLQWSLEELKSEVPSSSKGGDELSDKLNALAVENEELQRIICNLKDGRPLGSPDIVAELNALKNELKKLKDVRTKEKETFESELKKANEELDAMEQQFDSLSKENHSLKEELIGVNGLKQEIKSLNEQLQALSSQNKQLQDELSKASMSDSNDVLQKIEVLMSENTSLKSDVLKLSSVNEELVHIKQNLEEQYREKEELHKKLTDAENVQKEVSSLFDKIQTLAFENSDLKEKLIASQNTNAGISSEREYAEKLKQQLDYLNTELNIVKEEFQKVTAINQMLQQENWSLKESSESEIRKYIEKAENDVKNIENNLRSALSEIKELDTFIEQLIVKCSISIVSNNRTEKLRAIIDAIESLLTSKSQLEKEIENVKEHSQETIPSSSIQLGTTPPVFKGFSDVCNDPFDNLKADQESAQVEGLIAKVRELTSAIQQYEYDLSQLNAEKTSHENTIADLRHELAAMNEHVAKLNLMHSSQGDDTRLKLERADAEIARCRDEANNLRRELNNLVEKHSQEIEELRRNEEGSKEKVSEIEENFQNTLLNKEQENRNLKQILSEKEQLLANAINERNALQNQYESVSQQFFTLENRLRDLTRENEELQRELHTSRYNENAVIEKQKEEIEELMAKLEYLSQSQSLRNTASENEDILKQQIKELKEQASLLESSRLELQSKLDGQSNEISTLRQNIADLDKKRHYLENILSEKEKELEVMKNQMQSQSQLSTTEQASEKLISLIKEKDLEIARVSKVLLDTQERLVQVQESKPIDKVLSLQAKLDQALYTLHVRDVRCDELTQEIMQLLEERDTLQLRLSECLRENDILRKGTAASSATSSPEFKNKLGELHQGYKRDPAVQLDMESRHIQQMDLYAEKEEPAVDYGIFNWFFSTPSQQPQNQ